MEVTDNNHKTTRLIDRINSLGILGILPAGRGQIHYLDYVYGEPKETAESNVGFSSVFGERTATATISLKTFIKDIVPHQTTVMVAPDDPNFDNKLIEVVLGPALQMMIKFASENAEDSNNKLDCNIEWSKTGQRRLVSKILTASNMVATVGRRGPANFAIVSQRVYDLMTKNFDNPDAIIKASGFGNFCGLELLITDRFGDQVLVGRTSKDQPGVYVHIEDPGLEDFLTEGESLEPSAVNLRYAIESFGKKQPYFKFNVTFNEPILQTQGESQQS